MLNSGLRTDNNAAMYVFYKHYGKLRKNLDIISFLRIFTIVFSVYFAIIGKSTFL